MSKLTRTLNVKADPDFHWSVREHVLIRPVFFGEIKNAHPKAGVFQHPTKDVYIRFFGIPL